MENNSLLNKLNDLEARFQEVSTLITDPAVVADMKRYVRLNKEYRELEQILDARRRYIQLLTSLSEAKDILANESDQDLREMAREEIEVCETEIPKTEEEIKLLLIPADPQDDKNAILEIRGGTGGDEAAIFAGDLFRMYTKYCESKGWRLEVSSCSEGTSGGYKEIICTVSGEKVYGTLKYESGVHRVQRVPATETQGRVHTSAASVAVLPEAEAFDVEITESAIKWDTFRSSGAGGQNVNKVESGVRLRYPWLNPETNQMEEILIECTETRDQPKNKERALARLRTLIYDREHQRYADDIASKRKTRKIALCVIKECLAVAKASGVTVAKMQGHDMEKFLGGNTPMKRFVAYLVLPFAMKKHKKLLSGMLKDVENGKRCEIDFINGVVVKEGEKHGVSTPYCRQIVEIVHGIENGLYEITYKNADFFFSMEE